MAEIRPFNGYRFALGKPEDLAFYVAPPYDMLDAESIDALYEKSEYNIVRVTQNRSEKQDAGNRDRHKRASAILRSWISSNVLRRDEEPSVYLYEQLFHADAGMRKETVVRTGVVVLVKLADFDEKVVLPHEATLNGPKKDRYELLDETRTHCEQVFGLLSDDGTFFSLLRDLRPETPDGVFTDGDGVIHRLYRCGDRSMIEKLVAAAAGRTILIADGHHRYETALNFLRAHPGETYGHVMMTLVSTADPGLVIRPFHRLIRKTGAPVDMKARLSEYFTLEDHGEVDEKDVHSFLGTNDDRSMLFCDSSGGHLFGCVLNRRGEGFLESVMPEKSMVWKRLPVSMINIVTINTILGLPLDGHVLHDAVEYEKDVHAAVGLCRESEAFYGGFFIRPASIASVGEIVEAGERMPQKSTNFHPKIHSGCVLYTMDNG